MSSTEVKAETTAADNGPKASRGRGGPRGGRGDMRGGGPMRSDRGRGGSRGGGEGCRAGGAGKQFKGQEANSFKVRRQKVQRPGGNKFQG